MQPLVRIYATNSISSIAAAVAVVRGGLNLRYSISCKNSILIPPQRIKYTNFGLLRLLSNDSVGSKNTNTNYHDDNESSPPATPSEYLTSLGYDNPEVQKGMKDALKDVFGKNISISILKSLGNEGLKALANSVQQQIDEQQPSGDGFIGTVHVNVPHHKFNFTLKMKEGENLMQCAKEGSGKELLGEYLECVCGGNMSCATCHIILDTESYAKLDPPVDAECDMLDLAFEPTETSRLACQVTMMKELDGLVITLPSGVNNFWS